MDIGAIGIDIVGIGGGIDTASHVGYLLAAIAETIGGQRNFICIFRCNSNAIPCLLSCIDHITTTISSHCLYTGQILQILCQLDFQFPILGHIAFIIFYGSRSYHPDIVICQIISICPSGDIHCRI